MDKSTAEAYIEDLLEDRAQLLDEIRSLKKQLESVHLDKQELMRVSLAYVDKIMNNNHHIIDRVHE